ncbi:MAG: hypothetical protein IT364_17775 [Candidatus Hydrogenedentes bacterium]|nr:hypothetical protein [Candidatus Hydrogenedentota bacterium]
MKLASARIAFFISFSLLAFGLADVVSANDDLVQLEWRLTGKGALVYDEVIKNDFKTLIPIHEARPSRHDFEDLFIQFFGRRYFNGALGSRVIVARSMEISPMSTGRLRLRVIGKQIEEIYSDKPDIEPKTHKINGYENSTLIDLILLSNGKVTRADGSSWELFPVTFVLPEREVRIGDTWSVDGQCLSIYFGGKQRRHKQIISEFTLSERFKDDNGNEIAVLEFRFRESVDLVIPFPVSHEQMVGLGTQFWSFLTMQLEPDQDSLDDLPRSVIDEVNFMLRNSVCAYDAEYRFNITRGHLESLTADLEQKDYFAGYQQSKHIEIRLRDSE